MKTYRERYFEDYIAVPDAKRPGKVRYVYAGQYVEPFVEGSSLGRWKIYMVAVELSAIAIFFYAAGRDVLFNYSGVTAGMGILAILPWLLELGAVFRFVAARRRMKEFDRQSLEKAMEMGTVLHGILMLLMAAVGTVLVVRAGVLWQNIVAILGHLCMGALSFAIWKLYRRVYYHTYRDDGRGKADYSG